MNREQLKGKLRGILQYEDEKEDRELRKMQWDVEGRNIDLVEIAKTEDCKSLPGSPEALGCTCPKEANREGLGRELTRTEDKLEFWVDRDCPLHKDL